MTDQHIQHQALTPKKGCKGASEVRTGRRARAPGRLATRGRHGPRRCASLGLRPSPPHERARSARRCLQLATSLFLAIAELWPIRVRAIFSNWRRLYLSLSTCMLQVRVLVGSTLAEAVFGPKNGVHLIRRDRGVVRRDRRRSRWSRRGSSQFREVSADSHKASRDRWGGQVIESFPVSKRPESCAPGEACRPLLVFWIRFVLSFERED